MNNRDYKNFEKGQFVHIYNRGNNKEKVFLEEQDYKAFIFRLGLTLGFKEEELKKEKIISMPYSRIRITNTNKSDFKLHSFCLMPNHFHLLVEQTGDNPVSKLILKLCTSYSKYLNAKYKRVGHVFQDQFKSVNVENDSQLMWLSSYIHMNPVKDKIVNSPSQYNWSSYLDYTNERKLLITDKNLIITLFGGVENFKKETITLSNDPTVKGAL